MKGCCYKSKKEDRFFHKPDVIIKEETKKKRRAPMKKVLSLFVTPANDASISLRIYLQI